MRETQPRDDRELGQYLQTFLKIKAPARAVCAGHDAPMSYVADGFFERTGDCAVWAPRGGGKTTLAAALTLMESKFRKGCATRILGGSERQSRYMYEAFTGFLREEFAGEVAGKTGRERTRFRNGSEVEILTQSPTTVRGVHVPRLRLDEVEEFKREVFEAALYIPHSRRGLGARVEMLSTMHHPF